MKINGPGETPKIDPSRDEIFDADTTKDVAGEILDLYGKNGTGRIHDKRINTRTDKWCKSLNGLPAKHMPSAGTAHILALRVFNHNRKLGYSLSGMPPAKRRDH
jgi:hypothetical protein